MSQGAKLNIGSDPYNGTGHATPWGGDPNQAWKRDLIPGDQVLLCVLDRDTLKLHPCLVNSYPYKLHGEVKDWFIVLETPDGISNVCRLAHVVDRSSPPKADLRRTLAEVENQIRSRLNIPEQFTRGHIVALPNEAEPQHLTKERHEDKLLRELTRRLPNEFRQAVIEIVKSGDRAVTDFGGLVEAMSLLAAYIRGNCAKLGITLDQLRSLATLSMQITELQMSKIQNMPEGKPDLTRTGK